MRDVKCGAHLGEANGRLPSTLTVKALAPVAAAAGGATTATAATPSSPGVGFGTPLRLQAAPAATPRTTTAVRRRYTFLLQRMVHYSVAC